MSHTDKTDPLWVRMQDPANSLEVRIQHDHRLGPCDLDQYDHRRQCYWFKGVKTRCHIQVWPRENLYCGCSWCSRKSWSNWEGAHRVEWLARRQALLKGADRRERDIPYYK